MKLSNYQLLPLEEIETIPGCYYILRDGSLLRVFKVPTDQENNFKIEQLHRIVARTNSIYKYQPCWMTCIKQIFFFLLKII